MNVDHIIRLSPEDGMAGLHERLSHLQADAIVLLVPGDVPLLQRVANVRLLRRYAEETQKPISIVTRDRTTEDLARRNGLAVYSSLGRVPRQRRGGLTKKDLKNAPNLPGARIYRRFARLGCLTIALAVVALATAALVLVGVVLAPSATITVTPASEEATTTIDLTASSQIRVINSAKGQLPARSVQVLIEDVGVIETVGRKRVPDAAATGTVVVANRTMTAMTIAKGTIVRTATGVSIRFRTEEEALLPAGVYASVRVPVKAIEAGPTGNVKAGAISIVEGNLLFQVSVINDEDLRGGTEKLARYVTLQDRNNLREAIIQKIRAKSYVALQAAAQPGDYIPAESLTLAVNESSFDKPLDAQADFLSGKVRATVSGLVLEGEHLRTLVAARLRNLASGGFVVAPESVSYSEPRNVTYEDGIITLQITASARSRADVNLQDIQTMAAGQPIEGLASAIDRRFDLAAQPRIETQNALLGRMPLYRSRITVLLATP